MLAALPLLAAVLHPAVAAMAAKIVTVRIFIFPPKVLVIKRERLQGFAASVHLSHLSSNRHSGRDSSFSSRTADILHPRYYEDVRRKPFRHS